MDESDLSVHEYVSQILAELRRGPVVRWPSVTRNRDKALQALRKQGKIRYRKVNAGGHGWELISDEPSV